MPQAVTLSVGANMSQFERDAVAALKRIENRGFNFRINSNNGLGQISKDAKQFSQSMAAAESRVLAFTAVTGSLYAVARAFDFIFKSVVNVEKSLTDINVILQLSDKSLNNFGSNLFDIAKKTGQTFEVTAKAAAEFSRQGLGVTETLKRTQDALILTRLTGLDAVSAVEDLTGAINTFSSAALDSTQIINKFANVDAAFAVSAGDLAEAIKRTGAAAQEAGVGFEELLALVTAVKQTTAREAPVIGNAFKTIFQRLQRPDVLRTLESFKIQTTDSNGLISGEQLLQNIANVYKDLDPLAKNFITQLSAGVFQANIFQATLNDLAKGSLSFYAKSLKEANKETNAAVLRNEELNKTLSSRINSAFQSITKFSSNAGQDIFGPVANTVLNYIEDVLDSFDPQKAGADKIGVAIGKSIVQGIGSILNNPATFVLASVIVSKILVNLGVFTKEALSSFIAIEKTTNSLSQSLATASGIQNTILSGANQRLSTEREILKTLQSQAAFMSGMSGLVTSRGGGVATPQGRVFPNYNIVPPFMNKYQGPGQVSNSLVSDFYKNPPPNLFGVNAGNIKDLSARNSERVQAIINRGVADIYAGSYNPNNVSTALSSIRLNKEQRRAVESFVNQEIKNALAARTADAQYSGFAGGLGAIRRGAINANISSQLATLTANRAALAPSFQAQRDAEAYFANQALAQSRSQRITQAFSSGPALALSLAAPIAGAYAGNALEGSGGPTRGSILARGAGNLAQSALTGGFLGAQISGPFGPVGATVGAATFAGISAYSTIKELTDFNNSIEDLGRKAGEARESFNKLQATFSGIQEIVQKINDFKVREGDEGESAKRIKTLLDNLDAKFREISPQISSAELKKFPQLNNLKDLSVSEREDLFQQILEARNLEKRRSEIGAFIQNRIKNPPRTSLEGENVKEIVGQILSAPGAGGVPVQELFTDPSVQEFLSNQIFGARGTPQSIQTLLRTVGLGGSGISTALKEASPQLSQNILREIFDQTLGASTNQSAAEKIVNEKLGQRTQRLNVTDFLKELRARRNNEDFLLSDISSQNELTSLRKQTDLAENFASRQVDLNLRESRGENQLTSSLLGDRFVLGYEQVNADKNFQIEKIRKQIEDSVQDIAKKAAEDFASDIRQQATTTPNQQKILESGGILDKISVDINDAIQKFTKLGDAEGASKSLFQIQDSPELNTILNASESIGKNILSDIDRIVKSIQDATRQENQIDAEAKQKINELTQNLKETRLKLLESLDPTTILQRQGFNSISSEEAIGRLGDRFSLDARNGASGKDLSSNIKESFRLGLAPNQVSIFEQIRTDAVDTARTIRTEFAGAFKSFARGTKDAGDAFRDFALNIALQTQDKIIDLGVNSLFSSAFGKGKGGGSALGKLFTFSSGGLVEAGSGTKDDVPALLTQGEFVVRREAVEKYGKDYFETLNNGANARLANQFVFNDPLRPTGGSYNISSSLSASALEDDNNPQNRLRNSQFDNLQSYLGEKKNYDAQKAAAMNAFKKQRRQQLIGAYLSAGLGAAGSAIGSFGRGAPAGTTTGVLGASSYAPNYPVGSRIDYYGNAARGFANGGSVFGGNAATDSVPAMLSKGEFVIRKDAVDRVGLSTLNKINKGYASGGLVDSPSIGSSQNTNYLAKLVEQNEKLTNALLGKNNNTAPVGSAQTISIAPSITIQITQNGEVSSTANAGKSADKNNQSIEQSRQLGDLVQNVVNQTLIKESRPGGLVDNLIKQR